MKNNNAYNPILITGAERSGATLIARILDMCGVQSGSCNNMFENYVNDLNKDILSNYQLQMPKTNKFLIPVGFSEVLFDVLEKDIDFTKPWMIKHSTLTRLWPIWNDVFPDAKWIIVRRRTGDIINSCMKTTYMHLFKNIYNRVLINCIKEEDAWLWWVRQYELKFTEMIQAGLNCKIIWPDRMVIQDYKQILEMVEWLGLKWNDKIVPTMDILLNKSKDLLHENNN